MRLNKDKTTLSTMWSLRVFGYDLIFGWFKIKEAAEIGEDHGMHTVNTILNRPEDEETPQ